MKLSVYTFVLFVALSLLAVKSTQAANDPKALEKDSKAETLQCLDLRKAAQKVPVYTANIANRETTRTPEGGPYKRVDLICHEFFCESVAKEDFKFVHLPDSPDANASGMVRNARRQRRDRIRRDDVGRRRNQTARDGRSLRSDPPWIDLHRDDSLRPRREHSNRHVQLCDRRSFDILVTGSPRWFGSAFRICS